MSRVGIYTTGFKLALSNELIYRTNFIFGRIIELVIYGAMLFVYAALPAGAGEYTRSALLTYGLVAAMLSSVIYIYGMNGMANEIAEGDLTNYLLRPINYFGYWASRLMATRFLFALGGVGKGAVFVLFFGFASFASLSSASGVWWGIALTVGAIIMVSLFDFIGATFAFWAHRAYGPRWLITIFVQMLGGGLFPLDLFPHWLQSTLFATPFPLLVYTPVKAFMGDFSVSALVNALILQGVWIVIFGVVLALLWRRGVRSYEAYGR